jgi:hypothetical protein
MTEPTGKRSQMNYEQIYKLTKLIEQHCYRDAEGRAVYEAGWTDERLIEEMGNAVNLANVRTLRRTIIGPLLLAKDKANGHAPPGNVEALAQLAAEQEARIAALEHRLADVEQWASARPIHGFKKLTP